VLTNKNGFLNTGENLELAKKNPWIVPVIGFTLLIIVGIAVS